MSKKIWLVLSLVFPIVFLLSWTIITEQNIKNAKEIIIRAEGYDPRNLISGHYLNLRLNWQETDCSQFSDNLCHPNRFESIYQYYIPEIDAPKLDKLAGNNKTKIELVFAYPKNKNPYLKDMLINGKNWKQWLKENN